MTRQVWDPSPDAARVRWSMGHKEHRRRPRRCDFLAATLLVMLNVTAVAAAESKHAIAGIAIVAGRVEVVVESATKFEVRALPPILQIGASEFARSRSPEDGSLNRLIFTIPISEFVAMRSRAPIIVKYGHGAGRVIHGHFGYLDHTDVRK